MTFFSVTLRADFTTVHVIDFIGVSPVKYILTLNAPIATKVVCFFRLLKCLRSLFGKQCGPRSDCSSTLFTSVLNLSVMLGNYLQQTTSAGDIFRCIFFLGALRVNYGVFHVYYTPVTLLVYIVMIIPDDDFSRSAKQFGS